ncbi:hypothetical protein [Xylophilus sp.]|uniref:hypothetical protein n=1 Tax=Xylophilus sp. TaxID=2653893 RepID=UPI0013BC5BDA|nr:hypothetical protein [Xylophilus sp.]KAF1045643.1 MAG: hypothetical protein GAK38_02935 [Xylophilus sp.]
MNAFIACGDRVEQRIQSAIAWWCSAPFDERRAILFLVLPILAVAVIGIAYPALPAPGGSP